jgi:glycosyltransferase involved in cell wall biosynthesis
MIKKIAVILPAYNEKLTIVDTILDFAKELPEAEIIVIDNNSTDNTFDLACEAISDNNINGKVLFEAFQGKGYAVRKAFTEIDAEIYIMADADLTYPAKDVHKLIEPVIDGKADIVIGDRHSGGHYQKENKRNLHGFGNNLVKNMINFMFGSNLNDIMSGYRVFNKKFVKNYPIMVSGFQLETDMTLHVLDKRFKIIEIPIDFVDRPEGSFSKLNTFTDGFKVIITIINIFRIYKPFKFYTIISLFFVIFTLSAGIPVINEFINYKVVNHIPLAILSIGLGIISVLAFALGLILDAITHQHNVDFEHKILRYKD